MTNAKKMSSNMPPLDNSSEVDLTISIVMYRNYDEAWETVNSIEQHTSKMLSKYIYLIDNSALSESDSDMLKSKSLFEDKLKQFPDVIYIYTNENKGFGKGHNVILKTIKSSYHAIVNPDILLQDDAFNSILHYMNADQTVGMVIPKLVDKNGEIQKAYRRELTKTDMFLRMFVKVGFNKRKNFHTMQDMDYSQPFQVPFAQGSFLVIRTALFQNLGGFDDRFFMYMEDADLCKRVNAVSKVMYFPGASVFHKWEKGSHKNFRLLRIHLQSTYYYFKKWNNHNIN